MGFCTWNSWRRFGLRLGLGLAACLVAAAMAAPVATAQQKVLRAVLHADVRTLDPIWTTQTIAGIHAMLVYDTLFGNDDDQTPQLQMVGKYEISDDRLTYTFTLRDALNFHDGSPVTSKDVIASLKRWAARDNVGQRLFSFVDRLEAVDARTFRMILSKPYGMVLESLGKNGTSVAVIMREQEALTDPQQQIKEVIGFWTVQVRQRRMGSRQQDGLP
jgi:peptide/nickel transport system substrate-binding protein